MPRVRPAGGRAQRPRPGHCDTERVQPSDSDDARALADTLLGADEVRVFDGGLSHGEPLEQPAVLRSRNQSEVAELIELVRVADVLDGHCMCLGSSVIEFLAAGDRVAIVGLHHGQSIRWAGWSCDARLLNGVDLLNWLAARGYQAPLEQPEQTTSGAPRC